MGDKIIKAVEAILGGVITFLLLWVYIPRGFNIPEGFRGLGFFFVSLMVTIFISIFMIFVCYYLLTRNDKTISINNIGESTSKPIWNIKRVIVFLIFGFLFTCYFVLYLFGFF